MGNQRTLYEKDFIRVVTEEDTELGPTIWLADDLDEMEVSYTRNEMREILPILSGWVYGFNPGATIGAELLSALEALLSNPYLNLGDLVYQVREREGEGWDGPAVTAWSDAVMAAKAAIAKAKGED